MQADGTSYTIDWYWADPGAPLMDGRNCGSSNWLPEDLKSQDTFEVFGAARPWRNGSVPAYVGFDAHQERPIAGFFSWWTAGAPGPGSGGLRFDGSRGFTNAPGPGIFPPFPSPNSTYPLTSSIYGLGMALPPVPGRVTWNWTGRPTALNVSWTQNLPQRLFPCFPGIAWFEAQKSVGGIQYLECTSYNPATGVSTWIDVIGGYLDPGEVLTLQGV